MKSSRSATLALQPHQLYRACTLSDLPFETTADLSPVRELVGQDRATEAVQFGVGIRREGYNLFVMGPAGIGKHSLVQQFLEQEATRGPRPSDWCYVNNFSDATKPIALQLPASVGTALRHDIDQLIDELRTAIPAAFESEDYTARAQEIEDHFKELQEAALREVHDEAERNNVKLLRTPSGFSFAPGKGDEILSPEEFEQLPEAEKRRLEAVIGGLQERLKKVIQQLPQWAKATRNRIRELNSEVATLAVEHLISEVKNNYTPYPAVLEHLARLQQDVIDNVGDFRKPEDGARTFPGEAASTFRRYQVNVLVDRSAASGLPIVYEDQPTYQNLVGRVEHMAQFGALMTDFTLIRAGALHRANGGYLILDAHKILTQPFAWDGLKRVLRAREIRMDSLGQVLGMISTVSLEPQPIPLTVKVVLLGERMIYYLLCELDPDFHELFKVSADFEDHLDRNAQSESLYARFVATMAQREQLRVLDRGAVGRIIEHASRLVGDAAQLSTHMRSLADLVHESDYWAERSGRSIVRHEDVQQAIDHQIRRSDRLRGVLLEETMRGMLLIDTEGAWIGRVNGLSVVDLGGFSFGHPTRISATARLGEGSVVDIEREVELGGSIHSKGVLILSSFLGERYAQDKPLSLAASLVFEQSYGMIDGDSASLAELCALLSSLAGIGIQQSLAVTGSVNQHGDVQAIGGVNEKIEGFYDLCSRRRLSGEQGMLIPSANVQNLMLRHDVVDAAAQGRFHIYPVTTVDQAMELLTGVPAGQRAEGGFFPEGSVNALVEARLTEFSNLRHATGEKEKESP